MRSERTPTAERVVIVGGGLAGLTAATILARAGRMVLVLDGARCVGGRAITQTIDGFQFNLGPHALYRQGEALRTLTELGIRFNGKRVASSGFGVRDNQLGVLPASVWTLFTTPLLTNAARRELLSFFVKIKRLDPSNYSGTSVAEWLATNIRRPDLRDMIRMLMRVASYVDDPQRQSADVALMQLRMALDGSVLYIDGGWQTLIDQLAVAAQGAGAAIMTGARAVAIEYDGAVSGIRLRDGSHIAADQVLLAVSPAEAVRLLHDRADAELQRFAAEAQPVRLATLDLGLRALPRPDCNVVFGIDRPLYLSVHSRYARLAPENGVVMHVTKYLGATHDTPAAIKGELEAMLDRAQPGWRDQVVAQRFMPGLVVANALTDAARGGLGSRPAVTAAQVPGVYLAGDWVGSTGWLADAAMASARRAAHAILEHRHVPAAKDSMVYAYS